MLISEFSDYTGIQGNVSIIVNSVIQNTQYLNKLNPNDLGVPQQYRAKLKNELCQIKTYHQENMSV